LHSHLRTQQMSRIACAADPAARRKPEGRNMIGAKRKSMAVTAAAITSNYLVRLGLQQMIGAIPHIKLVGHAKFGEEANELIMREQPQVVIIDMESEIDATGLIQKIKKTVPHSKIIVLSGFDDKDRTREAFHLGVEGVVLKIQPPAVLIAIIEYLSNTMSKPPVDKGGGGTGPIIAASVPRLTDDDPSNLKWPEALTEREREVITLVGQGLSNKDIADRLCISGITVRHHLTSIFDKLGVSTRQKLLIRAHQFGLVELTASA
jgi:DNA-binding NarL/FixJ family response regulator